MIRKKIKATFECIIDKILFLKTKFANCCVSWHYYDTNNNKIPRKKRKMSFYVLTALLISTVS